jgi:hypothetical protein
MSGPPYLGSWQEPLVVGSLELQNLALAHAIILGIALWRYILWPRVLAAWAAAQPAAAEPASARRTPVA